MHNMPQLHTLKRFHCHSGDAVIGAMQPGLCVNRALKELIFTYCYITNEGIHFCLQRHLVAMSEIIKPIFHLFPILYFFQVEFFRID
jgi:hypothetical protein